MGLVAFLGKFRYVCESIVNHVCMKICGDLVVGSLGEWIIKSDDDALETLGRVHTNARVWSTEVVPPNHPSLSDVS